jgi:hypothetical protein
MLIFVAVSWSLELEIVLKWISAFKKNISQRPVMCKAVYETMY